MRVLVTGASGYIGVQVCKQAQEAGHIVRGTVRSKGNAVKVDPVLAAVPGIELVEADLLNDAGWAEAVKGVECVLHVASPFPLQPPADENELIKPAVEGTLRVLKAAAAEPGVKRVVLTSSVAAISSGHDKTENLAASEGCGADKVWSEDDWSRVEGCEAYPKSKTLAEMAAWKYIREEQPEGRNLELVVINPGFVIGPALIKAPCSSVNVISRLLKGELPMLPKLHMNCVDVRDVAKAHINAMEQPVAGQRFLLVSTGIWFTDMGKILADRFKKDGYSPPTVEAPYWLLWLVAIFDSHVQIAVKRWGTVTQVCNPSNSFTDFVCPPACFSSTFGVSGFGVVDLSLSCACGCCVFAITPTLDASLTESQFDGRIHRSTILEASKSWACATSTSKTALWIWGCR